MVDLTRSQRDLLQRQILEGSITPEQILEKSFSPVGPLHSKIVADKIWQMSQALLEGSLTAEQVKTAILEMGPGCLFDDFRNLEQVKGAMKVLQWLDRTYVADPDLAEPS